MESGGTTNRIVDKVRVVSSFVAVVRVGEIDIKISIDSLSTEKYREGAVLSELDWQKLIRLSIEFLAKNYSLKLLSYAPKSEFEIKRKIENKITYWLSKNKIEIDKDIFNQIVSSNLILLKQKKFIDDEVYVKSVLRRYKDKSRKEIYFKLIGKGIDRNIVERYLENFDDRERMAIKACIAKKTKIKEIMSDHERKKLTASLYRRGFSIRLVKTEIDDLIQNK